LLLADADGSAVAADEAFGQTVTEPMPGTAEQSHLVRLQSDLLLELPKHGLLRRFVGLDAALGKLPGVLANAPAPEEAALGICQYDTDVGPEAIRVYQFRFPKSDISPHSSISAAAGATRPTDKVLLKKEFHSGASR
jgi:hypothetical protein